MRTKLAFTRWREHGEQGVDLETISAVMVPSEFPVAVYVVPAVAVEACGHKERHHASLCANCGAYSVNGNWVLPKILRCVRRDATTGSEVRP